MPTKLFALSSVMLFVAPAVSVVVPVTASAPVSVIAPPAVTLRLPLRVVAASATGALSSVSVKLRNDAGVAGVCAEVLTFR